jgi:hypothetical protein
VKEEYFIFTSTVVEEREDRGRESFIVFHVTDVTYTFPFQAMKIREAEKIFSAEGLPPSFRRMAEDQLTPDEEMEKRG